MATLTPKERVLNSLLGGDCTEFRNFKMFRGDDKDVTVDQLCDEVHSALNAMQLGSVEGSTSFQADHGLKVIALA